MNRTVINWGLLPIIGALVWVLIVPGVCDMAAARAATPWVCDGWVQNAVWAIGAGGVVMITVGAVKGRDSASVVS